MAGAGGGGLGRTRVACRGRERTRCSRRVVSQFLARRAPRRGGRLQVTQTGLPLALFQMHQRYFWCGAALAGRGARLGNRGGLGRERLWGVPLGEAGGFKRGKGARSCLRGPPPPPSARPLLSVLSALLPPLPPPFSLRTDQGQVAFGGHFMAEGEEYFAMAEDELAGGPYIPLGGDLSGGDCGGGGGFAGHCLEYCESPTAHCNVLNWEQVQRLDGILSETIPIHGRGNFPTLELQPSLIVKVVRRRLAEKRIGVRDVRLNGSAASHVLHQDSGLGYKDLDLIFCADLRGEEEFQTVKDVVLDCLLDFLPEGVNKEKITPLTLKVNHLPPPPPPQRGPGPPRRAGRECCTADTRGSGRPPGPVCAPWLILLFSYLIFFSEFTKVRGLVSECFR